MAFKQGGNSVVRIKDGIATKTLRKKSTREKRERFRQEVEIIQRIQAEKNLTNVIEILEVNMDEEPYWYSMKAYSGDASEILSYTQGKIVESVNFLIPVVSTLKIFAELDKPIYHRDLKPDNLLYESSNGQISLILADFGCAYLKTDNEERLTQDFRAVGAMAYRAPEYHYGRVDKVDEKGDIFSIGKLLWFFINGICNEVFPYTLWFPPEYNLANRFPNLPGIERVNLLIASTVHHDPQQRIAYGNLLLSLRKLSNDIAVTQEQVNTERILGYESAVKLKLEERYAISQSLIKTFLNDLQSALSELLKQFPQSETVKRLRTNCKLLHPIKATLHTVIERESDCPLWNENQPNISIFSRIYPARLGNTTDNSASFPHAELTCNVKNLAGIEKKFKIRWYYDFDSGLKQNFNGETFTHDKQFTFELFNSAIIHLIS